MTRVCIAVPTFRRVAYLPQLLASLQRLTAAAGSYAIEVLIVDNDPDAGARSTIIALQESFPTRLTYEHCAAPGLSNVRNAILAYAQENADLLAMLDDDELPEPQWLAELLRVLHATGADAAVGPVSALLPEAAPRWIKDFRDREYPRLPDGSFVSDGWSSNCIMRVERIEALALRFDVALNFVGGEDQLFFRQWLAHGDTIAYAAHATVWEILPPERRSVGFILKRSFRRGNSLALCDRTIRGNLRGGAIRAAKGVAVIGLAILRILPATIVRGASATVASASEIARGFGMLAGLTGIAYQAYRRGA